MTEPELSTFIRPVVVTATTPTEWALGRVRIALLAAPGDSMVDPLMGHMSMLTGKYGFASVWHAGMVLAGDDWAHETGKRLEECDFSVILVGPSTPVDMMEAAVMSGKPVIPVMTRPFSIDMTPLGHLQRLPRNGKTVSSCSSVDEALNAVATEITTVAAQFKPAAAARAADSASVSPVKTTGSGASDFVEAVCAAFDTSGLNRVLYYNMDTQLAHVTAPGGLLTRVAELHRWLESNGRLREFVSFARKENPGNRKLQAYAQALGGVPTYPSFVDAHPPPWPDADFQAFQAVLADVYYSDLDIRSLLKQTGVNLGGVSFTGAARITWTSAIESLWNQGKARAFFDCIRSGPNAAAFARWA